MELLLSVSVVLCSIFWVSGSPDLGDSVERSLFEGVVIFYSGCGYPSPLFGAW
jgi:hypothetical protein